MEYGRSPPRIDGMVSLKVDNLAYRTTIDDLRRVFSRFGEVGDIYIPRDPYTFESRGFAFVRYCTDREADCAIRGMDGHKVDGREVRVQRAKYGRPTPNRRRRSVTPRRNGRRSRSFSSGRDRRSPRRINDRYRLPSSPRHYSRSRSVTPRRNGRRSRSFSSGRDRRSPRRINDRYRLPSSPRHYSRSLSRERLFCFSYQLISRRYGLAVCYADSRSVTPRRNGRRSRSFSSGRDRRSPRRINDRYRLPSSPRHYSRSLSRERLPGHCSGLQKCYIKVDSR
ncbi:putative splicing factor, arginine/serine-rich 4 [Schistosoma japonicum]|nr:putative splicing factor, arginine/serine-rich 4 [Schistosoma japonicum]